MTVEQRIDVISPAYVGEDRIALSIDPRSVVLRGHPITLRVDYGRADPGGGVALPLVLSVQPEFGDGSGFQRRLFRSFRPTTVTISVDKAGSYLVTLRESARNRWQARLRLSVEGERADADNLGEQRESLPRSFLGGAAPPPPFSAVVADLALVYADGSIVIAG